MRNRQWFIHLVNAISRRKVPTGRNDNWFARTSGFTVTTEVCTIITTIITFIRQTWKNRLKKPLPVLIMGKNFADANNRCCSRFVPAPAFPCRGMMDLPISNTWSEWRNTSKALAKSFSGFGAFAYDFLTAKFPARCSPTVVLGADLDLYEEVWKHEKSPLRVGVWYRSDRREDLKELLSEHKAKSVRNWQSCSAGSGTAVGRHRRRCFLMVDRAITTVSEQYSERLGYGR